MRRLFSVLHMFLIGIWLLSSALTLGKENYPRTPQQEYDEGWEDWLQSFLAQQPLIVKLAHALPEEVISASDLLAELSKLERDLPSKNWPTGL